jgi:hypothetical protein
MEVILAGLICFGGEGGRINLGTASRGEVAGGLELTLMGETGQVGDSLRSHIEYRQNAMCTRELLLSPWT